MSIMDVTLETWNREVLRSDELVLVDFWHEACPWCYRLEPLLEELAREYEGTTRFAKFNILSNENHWQFANKLGIIGAPTMMFFCKGRPIGEIVGYRPKPTLKSEIEKHAVQCDVACP